jgi:hypothetical protein
MNDIKFQYYPATIKSVKPIGETTVEQFIMAIKYPRPKTVDIMNRIRTATEMGDAETKTKLKEQLYYITPSVYVNGYRNYDNILHFTGLMPLDFDKLPSKEYAEEMKRAFFNSVPHVICAWMSSSGKGFRCLLKIPQVQTVQEFQSHFMAAQMNWGQLTGFDIAPKNAVLPLFISIDYNILFRYDAVEFMEKFVPIKPKIEPVNYYQNANENRVIEYINYKMSTITDAGHPIVRALSYYIGGLCGSGECNQTIAFAELENAIRNHPYTGVSSKVNTYLKTAKTMFEKGLNDKTGFL